MNKRVGLIFLLIGAAAVLIWALLRWMSSEETEAPASEQSVTVRVEPPRIGTIERMLSTSGTLRAGSTITVTSKISGRIERIPVQEGQEVAKGELLVQIEEQAPRLQLDQAYAAWQAAQAQYEKALRGARTEELENTRALYEKAEKDLATAEQSFRRSERLFESGAISQAQFEQAESTLRAARTELENAGRSLQMLEEGVSPEEKRMARARAEAAEATYELARLQLEHARIRAPGASVVAKVLQDEGNIVGTATPILVLVQDDRIQVEIELAEKYYGEILNSGASMEARIFPQAYPGAEPFQGRIFTVAPTINAGSRTFTVTVDILDSRDLLRPGMYAEVELILMRIEDAVLVPPSALLERDGRTVVFVAEGPRMETAAGIRPVVPGLADATQVQIRSGIDPQDRVIVEGNTFLEEGQRISVLEEP